jgi:Domain of Unknown Function (DUF928)
MTRIIAQKMIFVAAAVGLMGIGSAWAQTAGTATPRPVRVRAKLDGFDLTPKSATPPRRPNQIGGVSRGLGTLVLYAPTMGKSYTLTPTFSWRSDDPKGEYTLRISQPGMGADAVYEAKVVGDHFTYPADAPALKSGETYVWIVQPTVDMLGGPASASLVIVGGTERDAVDAALAKAKTDSDPAAAAAKVYTDMRLWFDAVSAYSSLIERFPARNDFYQARADLYDQLPATSALADADVAKMHK